MVELVAQALAEGAHGLSLGLLYPPGSYSSTDELVALARVAAQANAPLAIHVRNEGDGVEQAVVEALDLARRAGAALELSHQKAVGRRNWGKARRNLGRVAAAASAGQDVGLDIWPYTSGSTTITALLPGWVLEGGIETALDRLRVPERRACAIAEMRSGHMPGEALLDLLGFAGIRLAEAPLCPELEGRSLSEILAERAPGQDPWQGFLDLLLALELRGTMIIWEELDEDEVRALMASELTAIGTDSWVCSPLAGGKPHPRTSGAMPRFLRRYVLDAKLVSLEEGIRKLTSLPAARLRLGDRGLLRVGAVADITVLDPQTLTDRSTYVEPYAFPEGIVHVLVAGQAAVLHGQTVPGRHGRVLLRPGA